MRRDESHNWMMGWLVWAMSQGPRLVSRLSVCVCSDGVVDVLPNGLVTISHGSKCSRRPGW